MINTRLTEQFGLRHPVVCAPMAAAAGGGLAAAVTRAGGLGLIGGGYCDGDWIEAQFIAAGNDAVGCGFITWALADHRAVLTATLARKPRAVFLSFGDPMPFAGEIHASGVPLICQVQTLRDARRAAEAGAAVIVAQGSEAGGHGAARATLTLVPEVADMLAKNHPDILVLAAGGIGDGRGLAAALALGADGVLVGSRFWAAREALVPAAMHAAAVAADGDMTVQSHVMDIARGKVWPSRYACRVLENPVTRRWDGHEGAMRVDTIAGQQWQDGWAAGDPARANTFVGEVTGLIHEVQPAADILNRMVAGATKIITENAARLT